MANQTISRNIDKLLAVGTISVCKPSKGQFLSPCFLVPKSDGSQRLILNLKKLNEFLRPEYFKLEDRRLALSLIQSNYCMATLDVQDAYFMVHIAVEESF